MKGRGAGRTRRAIRLLSGLVVLLALVTVLGTVVPRPLIAANEPAGDEPTRRVLLLSNPIHTDIALPADPDVLARFAFLGEDGLPIDASGVEWLIFGWGGRAFYLETPTWADLKPGPLARALTLDRSVMHVSVAGPIDPRDEAVIALDLPATAFARLLESVEAGFARSPDGRALVIKGRSYGEYDLFYEGVGWFNAAAGCNMWTGAALRAAGLRTGWWNPLPQSLAWSLRLHNRGYPAVPASNP